MGKALMEMWLRRGVMRHLAVIMVAAGAVQAGQAGQAAEAPAATPGRFRSVVSAEKLEEAIKALQVDRILAEFAAGTHGFPECGWSVDFIGKDSKLIALGVEKGSVIESRAGVRSLACPQKPKPEALAAGDLVWVTPANERRSAAAPAGVLGFYFGSFANLPNWYLRHGQRDAKWDRQVVAALLQFGTDPALAEACWAEACKRGYRPDRLAACSGMMLALSTGEFPRAETFAKDFVPFAASTSPADFPTQLIDVFRLGCLTGHPEWLLKVGESLHQEERYAKVVDNFRHQVELAKLTPPGTPPPSELAKQMKRRSFLSRYNDTPVKWSMMEPMVKNLHERAAAAADAGEKEFPPVALDVELNHYYQYYISPKEPSPNIDVEIHFRVEAQPTPPDEIAEFHRTFFFGLADRDHGKVWDVGVPADGRILVAGLSFAGAELSGFPAWDVQFNGKQSGSQCTVLTGKGPLNPLSVPAHSTFLHAAETIHTLRIVRVGGQAEALLDGRRLALVHVPLDLKNPGLFFNGSGSKVNVTHLTADVLE